MIPYDDLVAALSSWRARQGLPVNTIGGSGSGPTAAAPGSGPHATPGSGPNRGAPPAPPAAVAALDADEVAEELLDDEAYENEGNDFAMGFGAAPAAPVTEDATAIGTAPERPTEAELGGSDRDRDDW